MTGIHVSETQAQESRSAGPERKYCFGYGFYGLERAGQEEYRWSRRFFGFYLENAPLRKLELLFDAVHETTLSISVENVLIGCEVIKSGRCLITLDRPGGGHSASTHLAFELGSSMLASGDPRKLGVKLFGLHISTDIGVVRYPASSFSYNASRSAGRATAHHFERARSASRRGHSNAQLNVFERAEGMERVGSSPLKLYLETAWVCNLRCPSCFHAYVPPEHRRNAIHFMSPFVFRKVVEHLFPGALMVWYNGNGETLLHPNAEQILQTALDYTFIPALATSGSTLTERAMRLLVEGGFFVTLSVDSPDPRDFERLRAGASYDKLTASISYMNELNRGARNSRFNLRIQCVAQQSNLHQLSALVQWAKAYGIGEVQFLPIQNFGQTRDYLERAKLQHTPDYANQQMLAAIRTGTALGVRVRPFPAFKTRREFDREFSAASEENLQASKAAGEFYRPLHRLIPEHPANDPLHNCFLAWSECFIGADGRVAPCDMYLDSTTAGNLYDDHFPDIWNGPQMAEMRRTVNRDPQGLCRFGTCMFRP